MSHSAQPPSTDPSGARSPFENLRVGGTIRGVIISYGIGVMALLLARSKGELLTVAPRQVLYMFLTGLGLQALLVAVRALVARYERATGFQGQLSPLAIYLFELVVDASTVFLFALATYRGILQYASAL
jgi:hypothetical protein